MRLYPRSWPQRHSAGLEALLDESPATLATVVDVLRGAVGVAHSHAHRQARLWAVAVLILALGEVVSIRLGATRNLLWPPTSPLRGVLLAVTFAPLLVVGLHGQRERFERRSVR